MKTIGFLSSNFEANELFKDTAPYGELVSQVISTRWIFLLEQLVFAGLRNVHVPKAGEFRRFRPPCKTNKAV